VGPLFFDHHSILLDLDSHGVHGLSPCFLFEAVRKSLYECGRALIRLMTHFNDGKHFNVEHIVRLDHRSFPLKVTPWEI
jgi:hypothetical protein